MNGDVAVMNSCNDNAKNAYRSAQVVTLAECSHEDSARYFAKLWAMVPRHVMLGPGTAELWDM